ncbi:Na+/H+ antiporter subunit E [Actinoplanes sp. OR16]|uniref:Na+/H+ antiporter subunit E n=1 Tax=Actinoplanes sp. OR16 TaxID=946334 RepID=UPI000F6D3FF5|nr:Na+/H+ antiporter subunit E [Actinoplanes sp. OR16]BBH67169.1 Na+/H+ antiporter subunit E [Actinoplanes sp. OR16]
MIAGRWRDRCVAAVALTVIWTLLWGGVTPITVVGGLLIAVVVLTVFPLPPVTYAGRVHPLGVLRFAARFAVDMVVASVQVALLAFRFGATVRSAVIAVRLRVPSDLGLTLTAEALSLVPGSLIVEVDRSQGILYVHVLGVSTLEEVEHFRGSVLALERRIVDAFGSPAERSACSSFSPGGPA